jgi:hypothetical protein
MSHHKVHTSRWNNGVLQNEVFTFDRPEHARDFANRSKHTHMHVKVYDQDNNLILSTSNGVSTLYA